MSEFIKVLMKIVSMILMLGVFIIVGVLLLFLIVPYMLYRWITGRGLTFDRKVLVGSLFGRKSAGSAQAPQGARVRRDGEDDVIDVHAEVIEETHESLK